LTYNEHQHRKTQNHLKYHHNMNSHAQLEDDQVSSPVEHPE